MALTRDEVLHIAKLARMELSSDEVLEFSGQISSILDYVDVLQEVDTEGVKETSQVTGLSHVLRKDEIVNCEYIDELLGESKYPKENNQIKVKKIM